MLKQAVEILHNKRISPERRRRDLIKLAESRLDLARMAEGSLGSHWSELTAAQHHQFVPLFAAFIEDAYLDKIQDYANLNMNVAGENFIDPNHVHVNASVVQPGQNKIPITFMLERRGNDWAVYDVAVEDVGMIENYQAQFDHVIRAHGVSQLIADLQAKQAQLRALVGKG